MALFQDFGAAVASQNQDDMLVIIPTFNNPTYLKMMVEQLYSRGLSRILVCDNASQMPEMLAYLHELAKSCDVVMFNENFGPRVYLSNPNFFWVLPQNFVITDPDLLFNPLMPDDFMAMMLDVLNNHHHSKVGLALDIGSHESKQKIPNLMDVQKNEGGFWSEPLPDFKGMTIYNSAIDTTFALYDKGKYVRDFNQCFSSQSTTCIRVAGNFTCQHMGWWSPEFIPVAQSELDYYAQHQTWSSALGSDNT